MVTGSSAVSLTRKAGRIAFIAIVGPVVWITMFLVGGLLFALLLQIAINLTA